MKIAVIAFDTQNWSPTLAYFESIARLAEAAGFEVRKAKRLYLDRFHDDFDLGWIAQILDENQKFSISFRLAESSVRNENLTRKGAFALDLFISHRSEQDFDPDYREKMRNHLWTVLIYTSGLEGGYGGTRATRNRYVSSLKTLTLGLMNNFSLPSAEILIEGDEESNYIRLPDGTGFPSFG